MMYTPGVLRWAQAGYKFKKDRKQLREVFKCFEHPRFTDQVIDQLLRGELPYRVEGKDVVIDLPD